MKGEEVVLFINIRGENKYPRYSCNYILSLPNIELERSPNIRNQQMSFKGLLLFVQFIDLSAETFLKLPFPEPTTSLLVRFTSFINYQAVNGQYVDDNQRYKKLPTMKCIKSYERDYASRSMLERTGYALSIIKKWYRNLVCYYGSVCVKN